ncbi:MAG TPA: enoyl-ACP reductase [Planctomycetota bacterium]|nr:enoyl-ACP reductase [Planctomycetota bacterium]
MVLMSGKKVVIFGIANKRSIAWGIAQALQREGAQLALNYQNERMEEPVRKLAADLPGDTFLAPCDVTVPGDIERFFDRLGKEFGPIDGLVHSIAFAKREELGGNFVDTSWEGYQMAQQVSAWSLIGLAKHAAPLMEGREAGIVCLTYYGAEKVVPNYNVMGVAKAALEASTRYLANDLGPRGVRVNAISAGPIKTVSAMGVADFGSLLDSMAQKSPLRRNVDQGDVGNVALFLLSNLARGITGQTIYVDAGYSIMGA